MKDSRGDFRDAGYVPGQPETYTASEKCVGCLAVAAALREIAYLVEDNYPLFISGGAIGVANKIRERIPKSDAQALDAYVQEKVDRVVLAESEWYNLHNADDELDLRVKRLAANRAKVKTDPPKDR